MSTKECTIEGCDRRQVARAMCPLHYRRWQRSGDPNTSWRDDKKSHVSRDGICSVDECGDPIFSRGWCGKHYGRWQRHGDPLVNNKRKPRPENASWKISQFIATGVAECNKHGQHTDWKVYQRRNPGHPGFYRTLQCKPCNREGVRKYEAANPEKVREKYLTLHARAVRHTNSARNRCRQSGWDYDLSPEWVEEQFARQDGKCAYTGQPFDLTDTIRAPLSLSLERIDPQRGYTQDNVLLVCWRANFAKSDMTLDVFRQLCADVIATLGVP